MYSLPRFAAEKWFMRDDDPLDASGAPRARHGEVSPAFSRIFFVPGPRGRVPAHSRASALPETMRPTLGATRARVQKLSAVGIIPLNAALRLRNGSCETMTLPLDGALSRGFCEVWSRFVWPRDLVISAHLVAS